MYVRADADARTLNSIKHSFSSNSAIRTASHRRGEMAAAFGLILELFVRLRSRWPRHRINRMLHALGKGGILTSGYRRLAILDPDRLVEEAAIDTEVLQAWGRRAQLEEPPRCNQTCPRPSDVGKRVRTEVPRRIVPCPCRARVRVFASAMSGNS